MRALWLGVGIMVSTGCLSTPGIHPTLHPSAPGTGNNGGVALGAMVQSSNDSTNMQIGYGEGWARIGPGGALELRTTPQAAFVAYELPLTNGNTAVSLRPSLGASVLRISETNAGGTSDTSTNMILHPGATLVVNAGSAYIAPRVGLGFSNTIEGDGEGETVYSGGVTGGFRLGAGLSAELSIIYSTDGDDNDAWAFVPSVGISVP